MSAQLSSPPAGHRPNLALGRLHLGSSPLAGSGPGQDDTANHAPMDHQDLISSAVIARAGSDEQASATPTSDWGGLSEGVLQLVSWLLDRA